MAWRQSPGGSEQHLTRAAAAARTRTQRPGKHLAVHASELVVKPDFQILRRYRRPLLLCLEHTHRPALEDYVHRATRLGSSRSLNLRIGIRDSNPPPIRSLEHAIVLELPGGSVGLRSFTLSLSMRGRSASACGTMISRLMSGSWLYRMKCGGWVEDRVETPIPAR